VYDVRDDFFFIRAHIRILVADLLILRRIKYLLLVSVRSRIKKKIIIIIII
jgi:hypothetical protein